MDSKIIILLIFISILSYQLHCCTAQPWTKAGYWYAGSESPIPDINSALFTHLICGFANVSSTTYQLSIPPEQEQYFSSFTNIVKSKNPSVITLLSIWNGQATTAKSILGEKVNTSVLSSMLNQSSYRKSFIESSIKTARQYGFQGIDLFWLWPNTASDMTNMGILLDEWRAAVDSELRNSSESKLILTMALYYLPSFEFGGYPIGSIQRNMDWAHVVAYDYHLPLNEKFIHAHAVLYDPSSNVNTDYGIRGWLAKGFPPKKLVFGLPYHGYAWTLVNPKENAIGAPSSGRAETEDGSMSYKYIKTYIQSYNAKTIFNATFVMNYCIIGSTWINFDDVESIRAKISYAKQKNLRGYNVFQVSNDDNWMLSQAAQEEDNGPEKKRKLLLIIMLPTALIIIILAFMMYYIRDRVLKSKGMMILDNRSPSQPVNNTLDSENLDSNDPNPKALSLSTIKVATNDFSSANKLGEGGFGPVYKGILPRGQEIAVKRLSKTSTQGHEEFANEVALTARLQHINLVRVLGFCIEGDEKMLIYEYMPNKSLDLYLYDPIRQHVLDWRKRVHIIEGITQGLLYLQEYSNFTIIHRDLKASNILLDKDLNPKISDFGMAKLFGKDEHEANTDRIVGTYGYVPPEYVRKGVYSMKYDVYSFGVLLLQIISGKRNSCYYGTHETLTLLEYAYEKWIVGEGMDFIDPSLDDSSSSCKLITCLQVALLCVQENPVDRPTMLEVYSMLKNDIGAISTPKRPAFSTQIDEKVTGRSTSEQGSCSVYDSSISQISGR
ncbi:cysteine-rich receptor-like protein kinase 19 [Quercus lobata]|uniref:non-specific serine/threonine protein kinase n=1 Tax=Quercus lobata TaxID=97700 RepID=A0A7N2L211_QUELO|nr:cysteine-rich receptor-like protein kinase 19 [Quercus lobata]